MPLLEFYLMAKSKIESSQQKTTTYSSDPSFLPDKEVVELVRENGEILMQRQSDRARKNPVSKNFPSLTTNLQKDVMNAIISKMGKAGTVESIVNHIPMLVPSSEKDLDKNDDMFPWLYHPTDDTLQQDYFPEILSDITANVFDVAVNEGNSCSKIVRYAQSIPVNKNMSIGEENSLKVSASRIARLYPWSLLPSDSRVSDIISKSSDKANCVASGDSGQGQESACSFPTMIIKKLDSGHASNTPDLLNFSHFSRPATRFRANVQNTPAVVAPCSANVEGLVNMNTDTTSGINKDAESTLLDSSFSLLKEMHLYNQPNLLCSKVDSRSSIAKSLKESCIPQQSDSINNNMSANGIVGVNISLGGAGVENTSEIIVASSAVCPGNRTDRASNHLKESLKRTCRDNEECECQSEDIEEESEGVNKAVSCQGSNGSKTGSKRSRSAEVHNLSERRRRDRINEKMRALHKLIPNCNKVDKASMLDEAIEYLKTLQLQVQIMSMGAGLCMMLPTGMQHIHTPHMLQFLPTNAGMGMRKGYGMGTLGMNSGPPGCPMIPMLPIQGLQFPSASILSPITFQGISGYNFPFFKHPGHGFHMLVPRAPLIPPFGQPLVNSAAEIGVPVPTLKPTDLMQNTNSQAMHNADPSGSIIQTSQDRVCG